MAAMREQRCERVESGPASAELTTPKSGRRKKNASNPDGCIPAAAPAFSTRAAAAAPPSNSTYTRTTDPSKKKLEAAHAAEVAKLRRQIKELEEARATLLRATKHITHPLEQALAGEVARRKAVEVELATLRSEMVSADAAREAADTAKREAAVAIEAQERVEAEEAMVLLRAKEFISSHTEKVERVRQYAQALESIIQTVEVEKAAVESRWRQVCASEIDTARLQNALELASVRHSAMEASEEAKATTRAAELQVAIADAAVAAAEVKATAALVSQKELAALVGPSNNDAQLKQATDTRLAALKLELEASKAHYEVRLRVVGQIEKTGLDEVKARVQALEQQVAACKAEVLSLVELNTAKTHEAHLSSVVQSHEVQLQLSEAAAKLASAEAEVKHGSSAMVARLEQATADAATVLEHASMEARAKQEWAETIASATLEMEKETAVVHTACAADKMVAEREGMSSMAWAVEKETEAVEKARVKADELKAVRQMLSISLPLGPGYLAGPCLLLTQRSPD